MNTDMSRRQFVGLAGSLATVLGLGLVGCGGGAGKGSAAGSAAAKDVKGAAESKKLVVGFDKSYPPYGFVGDDGEYTGFDLDLAKAVADKQGWEVKYEAIDWDAKDTLLNSGAINCIWNGFTMNGREEDYTWSKPYVDNSQVIVVPESSDVTDLSGLAGKIVGVQAASAALELLSEGGDQADLAATFGSLQQFPDYNNAFVELQAGSIDAVAMDIGVAQYQLKQKEGYKILDEKLNSEKYAIGFKLGNEELRDTVDDAMEQLVADGTFAKLAEKYELTDMVCLGTDEGETETETEGVQTEAATEAVTE